MNYERYSEHSARKDRFKKIGMIILFFMALCTLVAVFWVLIARALSEVLYSPGFERAAFLEVAENLWSATIIIVPLDFIVAFVYFKYYYAKICKYTGGGIIYEENYKYFNPKKELSSIKKIICFVLVVWTFGCCLFLLSSFLVENYAEYLEYVKHDSNKADDLCNFYTTNVEPLRRPLGLNSLAVVLLLDILCLPLFIKCFSSFTIPRDEDIDKQFIALCGQFQDHTLNKYVFSEKEINDTPIIFLRSWLYGRKRLGDLANANASDVMGKDYCWRSSEVVLTAWLFTEDKLIYFSQVASLVSDKVKDFSEEIDYKDITSLGTSRVNVPVFQNGYEVGKTSVIQWMLRHSGEEEIQCLCCNQKLAKEAFQAMLEIIEQRRSS